MKNASFCIRILIILFAAKYTDLRSQTENSHHPWWVNVGAGPALISTNFAMSAGLVYCYQFDKSIISARIIGSTNKNPTIQRIDITKINYSTTDYGILYGPMWQSGSIYVSMGAGVGLIRLSYDKTDHSTSKTSISLPLEVQWFWRPTYFAGIGLYFGTALNSEEQLSNIMICVQLGVW